MDDRLEIGTENHLRLKEEKDGQTRQQRYFDRDVSAERRCVGREEVRRQRGGASTKWSCVGKVVVRRQSDNDCDFKIPEKNKKTRYN